MGRYVTPQGVEIEMGDEAARVIGYKPVEAAEKPAKKAPAKRASGNSDDK